MRITLLILTIFLYTLAGHAQTCQEVLNYVKSSGNGTKYYSPTSEAVSEVTFYTVIENYSTYYFAVVKFTSSYYKEYIYQVASNTKFHYGMNYLNSAGKAFWEYIQPYNKNLGCAPKFE